jgi:hypothetical protein
VQTAGKEQAEVVRKLLEQLDEADDAGALGPAGESQQRGGEGVEFERRERGSGCVEAGLGAEPAAGSPERDSHGAGASAERGSSSSSTDTSSSGIRVGAPEGEEGPARVSAAAQLLRGGRRARPAFTGVAVVEDCFGVPRFVTASRSGGETSPRPC